MKYTRTELQRKLELIIRSKENHHYAGDLYLIHDLKEFKKMISEKVKQE